MTAAEPDPGLVWTLVAVLGVGTFLLRLSFIQLYAWLDEFPPEVERALGYIPAAILAALVLPAVVSVEAVLAGTLLTPRLLAATVAALVAWRTGSFTATILVGMGVLWAVQFGL
jgi:branched-subunit amino acid transport protein